ncbi:GtrA family protein [Streptomyces yaizuensis]|uniref:GtrA family protein n=1 Tax=Streptomyces yaizuensis TaxID=2989713 RepID=A0ABQ5P9V5_9ACTN|nr:GtrA family protein [Streptomyces sp. YSPA8]GLF99341.1 GtrA family protein [Streptomyces sp. YSPA8]
MTVRGQLFRFALVGAVNTGTYYGLYLLLLLRLPYVAAHVAAFALSMVGSFFLTSYFTYRTRPTWRKFLLFPLTNAANFVITTAGVYLLVDVLEFGSRYAPLIAAAAAIPVTFVLSRTIMLRPEKAGRDAGGPGQAAQAPARTEAEPEPDTGAISVRSL